MRRGLRYLLLLLTLLTAVCFAWPAQAAETTVSGPDTPALVISGSSINRGQGFLHNYVVLSRGELDHIAATASGEATFRLGLGDCFTEALVYSTYEDHGTPAWIYRRVYGLDLRLMAEALGVDTGQVMSVSVYADDGMSKTLSDAFGVKTGRWTYDFSGARVAAVSPILALYETTTETRELAAGVMPPLPQLGANSPDRVDNVFGYGQTDVREITSCYWVKNVRRLRFGAEAPALTVRDAGGSVTDMSLSTMISRGVWQAGFGAVKAQGVPVERFLSDLDIGVPAGHYLRAQGLGSYADLTADQLAGAFLAWQATDNGSAVKNATPLRLYCGDGRVLADLTALSVISAAEADTPPVVDPGFTDLANYGWAREAVEDLYRRGVVKGVSAERFGPGQNIKRGDFMLMLARAYSLSSVDTGNFNDVPAGSYYYDAIAAAKALGVAKGDGGVFRPDSPITRQEALVLLHRTLILTGQELPMGSSALDGFSDGDLVADWARAPVGSLAAAGVIQGSNNAVDPLGLLTRAEMAVILKRALDLQ